MTLTHPAYGLLRPVTDTASVLLCDNPGVMTLEGTNTWVLRGPGSDEVVVVDPGPDDVAHIERVAASGGSQFGSGGSQFGSGGSQFGSGGSQFGRVALVLITHRHGDHTDGIDRLVEATGAAVRSIGSGFQRALGGPLTGGEVIDAAGLRITVMATPGHTADSVCFVLDDAVLTGDTVLGRGTTVIDDEDGSLADYLDSLRRLSGLGHRVVLPGHGPELPDLSAAAEMYLAHRQERLDQIRAALRTLGQDATARQVVEHVYADVDEKLWDAAEWSVRAQLAYLREA